MTDKPKELEQVEFRLVVIESDSMRVLTASATAAGPLLPRVSIPGLSRTAAVLNKAIEEKFGLRTMQLALLPRTQELNYCAVHEVMSRTKDAPASLSFCAIEGFLPAELPELERMLVLKIMRGELNELGRFARLGSIGELLSRTGISSSGGSLPVIQQLNQGINFCLLSITDDDGRKRWFKAVGEPNTHEYLLTLELTRRFPKYLPRMITTIPEWNGWITENVEGVPLNESNATGDCEQALEALAIMQQSTAQDVASLLAAGAKNWTYARMASLLEPFFQDARLAMKAQPSTRSKPLVDNELDQLQTNLETALREFMEPDVPDTLVHGDIGHGNIIATPGGPVFLDWAETYIGHPFLCAEHLLADLARSNPRFAREEDRLRSFYADHWRTYVGAKELETITALAPAIAAFVYALVAWEANRNLSNPSRTWPLLRSMLRRTKREFDIAPEVIR